MTKATLFVLCLLCATAGFGQAVGGGSVLSSEVQVLRLPDHSQHASQQPMATERSLLESFNYTYVQGERPLWEFAPASHAVPLGDIARMLRKDHELVKKAEFVRND
jgi:hypothetical protein